MIYFTSDAHFSHKNILRYEDRPFDSVEHMNECMIDKWNNKVKHDDTVYILGDLYFGNGQDANRLIRRLNGNKLLIKGNHDSFIGDTKFDRGLFGWIKDYYELRYESNKFIMFHYPIAVWNAQHHGAIHLYGHVHSNKDGHHPLLHDLKNAYNVGVDVNNYEPISINEVLEKMQNARN